jgi:hypothetical protein
MGSVNRCRWKSLCGLSKLPERSIINERFGMNDGREARSHGGRIDSVRDESGSWVSIMIYLCDKAFGKPL